MLWPDLLIPLPLEFCLRCIGVWPENNYTFIYPLYALLSIVCLIFQFWNIPNIYHDMELLSISLTNTVLVSLILIKTTMFWIQRRYAKDVLNEMADDWCTVKAPEEIIILNNHAQFSQKFFVTSFIAYNSTIISFIFVAFWTYSTESVENRLFPLQASFPFSGKISPIYEFIYFLQSILLFLIATAYCVTDSSYVAMVLHAATKAEMLRLELDRFFNGILKLEDKWAIKVLIEKHLKAINFTKKVENIYSGQLFIHFTMGTLQICFEGFTYLMALTHNSGINALLKNSCHFIAIIFELVIYCVLGEYLQTKSNLIADAAYLLPWYDLQSSKSKIIIMFILRAQKPLTITCGKIAVASHLTLLSIMRTAFSYLSVLRASQF